MRQLFFIPLLFVLSSLNAQNQKSFKLEFYAIDSNTEDYVDFSTVTKSNKHLLDTANFVCEVVNVFDPDSRINVTKFDFSIQFKDSKQTYNEVSESRLLEIILQTEALSDSTSPAKVTVTKVYYKDSKNIENFKTIADYDYETIMVQ